MFIYLYVFFVCFKFQKVKMDINLYGPETEQSKETVKG